MVFIRTFLLGLATALATITTTAMAQDAHVMGHVADEKGEHMHYVTIMLKGTTTGCLSDETGHFFLKDLPIGRQTIVFSCVGYTTLERAVELGHDQMLELNIVMQEESYMMDEDGHRYP